MQEEEEEEEEEKEEDEVADIMSSITLYRLIFYLKQNILLIPNCKDLLLIWLNVILIIEPK